MASQPDINAPDPSKMKSQKRNFTDMQNDAIDEELAEEPFNAIKPEEIAFMVNELCDRLTKPLVEYASIDKRYGDLDTAAQLAKQLPAISKYSVAVLGEQGTGKSTVINALIDRSLLDQSGSSKACTAYATVLEYKEGADDQTTSSDVIVEFLTVQEIDHCIEEQINLWADAYQRKKKMRQVLCEANEEDGEDAENGENGEEDGEDGEDAEDGGDAEDGEEEVEETEDKGEEAKEVVEETKEDEEVEESPDTHSATQSSRIMTKKRLPRGAVTAKEFFQIIFDIQRHNQTGVWLEKELHYTDIREGKFLSTCRQQALNRFSELAMEMRGLDIVTRKVVFHNIPDRNLGRRTATIRNHWPFVKVVTISTGHILFRHGLRLFDLPGKSIGYGDMSQLRESVTNKFRRKADFEIVVAPCSRLQTSVLHDRYIDRSIHLKGPNKTILVMNKSDELINIHNMGTQIRQISEHPFPGFVERLEDIDRLSEQEDADDVTLMDLLDGLLREATVAYIKHETANVQKQMQPKGIKVFAVSALSHANSRHRFRRGDHILDEKTAGIGNLRQFLAKLSTATNYQKYHEHVHKTLPALRNQGARLLEEHTEDKTYAEMRCNLKARIELLRNKLESLIRSPLESVVEKPWSDKEAQCIIRGIKGLVQDSWVSPRIRYQGFAKMLREHGIPINGKYSGRNMNQEILNTMETYYGMWKDSMCTKADDFALPLHEEVDTLLQETRLAIENSSADPALKERAEEERAGAQEVIEHSHDTLLESLGESIRDTHLDFTTEIDISCPIATEMEMCYKRAQDRNLIGSGRGIYNRQRMVLQESIIDPPRKVFHPLLERIATKMQTKLKEAWKIACETFITDALEEMGDFSNTAEQLLMNAAYATAEHKQARGKLRELLTEFDASLKEIEGRFVYVEGLHADKKHKREETENSTALVRISDTPNDLSLAMTASTGSSAPLADL
ncbi:nuclear gtpase slip-gc-like [Pyrenophora seminiperda CCB06]|uniref:Nuclear gtpase slip-gc-like n=1 Tax=Pyrenophora seminiperda CCB06 TaxID=1302712 RepID=A0A3M7M694_9PLEO|nr:nuclear gtpase slip-gc-like [Pyrenophora seminiperda CCB06]